MVMAVPIRTSMGPARMFRDPRLLTLTQWLSPAYPTGAFAWSHGLETAVAEGWAYDEDSLEGWLRDVISEGTGRMDAIWIIRSYGAETQEAVLEIDGLARAYAASTERLLEGERQGAAFARVTRQVWALDLPDMIFPVALGRATRLADLPCAPCVALYLQGVCTNLVSAAQRLMPLGQTGAQRVLHRLMALCVMVAEEAAEQEPCSQSFLSDIAAMRHETQKPRIFQS